MTKELVISANRHETKVAVLEDDQLVEIFFQRAQEYSLAGSVHKGRVTRVLPGMQSAFVDLGLERDTFLYVSDFFEESDEYEKLPPVEEKPSGRRPPEAREQRDPRELREVREAKPTPIAAVAPSAASPAAAEPPDGGEETVPADAGSGAVPAERPQHPRGDRPDRRMERPVDRNADRAALDRGGRRGRRRRGRGGRGLPDSKYAEARPIGSHAEIEIPAEKEFVEVVEAQPLTDFAVLPGESLAKYSRPSDEIEEFDGPDVVDSEPETSREQPAREFPEETAVVQAAEPDEMVEEPAEIAEPPEEGSAEAVEEDVSGLTEAELDAIQLQAEAIARGADPVRALPDSLPVKVVSEEEDDEEEEDDVEELAAPEAGAQPPAVELAAEGPDGAPVPPPPLASIDSMASSHREQTSRYLRRGRMRRRRGQQDPNLRTVNRETREGGEPREAPAPRDSRREGGRDAAREASRAPVRDTSREAARESRDSREKPAPQSITELLKEGQEIVVQIAKEPMGQKGARITSHIALPGRFCVYMPTVEHLGVSRKIASDEERQRLRRILQTHRQGIPGGFIIRTAGEGKTEEQIAADILYLFQLWTEIKQKSERQKAPALLYHDVEVVQRLLRDQLTDNFKNIWVDNEDVYESVMRFVQRMQPALVNKVKLYTRTVPIFDAFNITTELEKALRAKVWLKSGGYIVINQTEALVAIDVNTGKYVGKSNRLEDTIVKTNTDAVKEIVRQIRLRDLGGIIVVDFIDMDERKNRQKVMQALEEAMRTDRAPNKILQFNDFGLVAITRKRVKQSLERTLCSPCSTCEGSGYTKSVTTVISEILMEAQKLAPHVEGKEISLRVHPSVAISLKSKDNDYLEEIEELFRRPVFVTGDPTLHPEKFDIG
ncbi:MAG TPA: Rne/Rng family ribonuclease [Bryobacteraceae bacterium]|nr:Rne/Rng family ribonuclease [Bryobacteraceae bacterium]